jgi:hypothetical protein
MAELKHFKAKFGIRDKNSFVGNPDYEITKLERFERLIIEEPTKSNDLPSTLLSSRG